MLPVYKPVRFNVGYDVTSGALVLVELLRDEHPQLHPNLLHKPVHPKRGHNMNFIPLKKKRKYLKYNMK